MHSNSFATAQNVLIRVPSNTIGRRIVAYLLDVSMFVLFYLLVGIAFPNFDKEFWPAVFFSTLFFTLPLIQETVTGGASVGKLIMNIRVVKIDGSNARFSDFLMRWIVGIVELTAFGVIAVLTASMSKRQQRLGDMAADTMVISYASSTNLDHTRIDISDEHRIEIPEVDRLSSKQISLIMRTLYRHRKSPSKHTRNRIDEISKKAALVMGYEVPEDSLDFLDQIVKDYTYIHDE